MLDYNEKQLNLGVLREHESAIVDRLGVKAAIEHGRPVSIKGAITAALVCMGSDDPARAWRVYYDRGTDKADFTKAIAQGVSVSDYLEAVSEAKEVEIEGGFLE